MGVLTPRTPAQREWIVEQRLRAIATGEWMEKVGLADVAGPPIGDNFVFGESLKHMRERGAESHQAMLNRAARSGIYVPGQSPLQESIVRGKAYERDTGEQIQNAITSRFKLSLARGGAQSGWEVPDLAPLDYSMANWAAATTNQGTILGVPQGTNAAKIGSPDAIGAATAADTASRKTGTGQQVYFTLLSFWIFAMTAAGGLYNPAAGNTIQPFVASGPAAATIQTALSAAATVLNTLAAFWTQVTLVSPADRALAVGSPLDPQAGVVNFFFGEALLSRFVTGAALNVQGNSLAAVAELA